VNKTCNRCDLSLPVDHFYRRKTSPDGVGTVCKNCVKKNRTRDITHWDGDKLLCLRCREYKDPSCFTSRPNSPHRSDKVGQCKECRKALEEKRRICNRGNGSIDRVLLERFLGARDRASRRGIDCDITVDHLKELWVKQDGLCAISGLPMSHIIFCGRVPTNVSVDRINSRMGYVVGNIQLVCMAINQMKSDLGMEDLLRFCEGVINQAAVAAKWKH